MGPQKLLGYGLGGAATLYVTSVAYDVFSKQRAERQLEETVISELSAAQAAVAAERKEQGAILSFQQAVQQHQQGIQEVEAEIQVTQAKLADLEEVRATRAKEAADAAAALEGHKGKLARLVQEARRHRQAAATAESALTAAHQETMAARALYNPLHHPLVASFRSSGQ